MNATSDKPFLPGLFRDSADGPHLIGSRCRACGSYYFPRVARSCRNPACGSDAFEDVPLSRVGRVWSYTDACYQPPEPFVAADPYEPFAIAAVELEREKMIVLGPVVRGVGVDVLEVGARVELVIETLSENGGERVTTWKWKPV